VLLVHPIPTVHLCYLSFFVVATLCVNKDVYIIFRLAITKVFLVLLIHLLLIIVVLFQIFVLHFNVHLLFVVYFLREAP